MACFDEVASALWAGAFGGVVRQFSMGWDGLAIERTMVVPDVMMGIAEVLRVLTDPGDVVVVVEHLVVKATLTRMSFDEDGVGSVDHDLPDVGILQQDGER